VHNTAFLRFENSTCLDYRDKNENDVFVNNRVKQIQALTTKTQWFHVNTTQNPADCASRGLAPGKIKDFDLWWNGPSWIKEPAELWEKHGVKQEIPNDTAQLLAVTQVKEPEKDEFWHKLLQKFSSFNKTIKVVARLKRFIDNSKKKQSGRLAGPITVDEWDHSHNIIIKALQQEVYGDEIRALKATDL
jgi:hypothetical protein